MRRRQLHALRRARLWYMVAALAISTVAAWFIHEYERSRTMPAVAVRGLTPPAAQSGIAADPVASATPLGGEFLRLTPSPEDDMRPGATTPDGNRAQQMSGQHLWLSPEEIAGLPTAGLAWEQLQAIVQEAPQTPDIYDKDDDGDVTVLARALSYGRTGRAANREAVLEALQAIMNQELNPARVSILAVARNLPGYVIAADIVELWRDERLNREFQAWLRLIRDTEFSGDGGSFTIARCHETRPNNFGTHCGAARLAIALYLQDEREVQRAATVFHGWLGNREAYAGFIYGRLNWQADPERPVAINPPDAVKNGQLVDGALPEEMRRGGDFRWPPKRTGYAWEALQGAIVQAELLARAGYPAWEWQERALLRAVTFLYDLGWEANGDDLWQPWLINYAYGSDFPVTSPARPGKNMGWTDWTHGAERAAHDAAGSMVQDEEAGSDMSGEIE